MEQKDFDGMVKEANRKLAVLSSQRNNAMDQVAMMAATYEELKEQFDALKKELDALKESKEEESNTA